MKYILSFCTLSLKVYSGDLGDCARFFSGNTFSLYILSIDFLEFVIFFLKSEPKKDLLKK
jgi:hypothetical protein